MHNILTRLDDAMQALNDAAAETRPAAGSAEVISLAARCMPVNKTAGG